MRAKPEPVSNTRTGVDSAPKRRGRPAQKSEGEARQRLLAAAATLFAEQGFAETSTREICTAAGLNAGAIHYHFGDKDGLYRAVLSAPLDAVTRVKLGFDAEHLSLREGLSLFFEGFLGDLVSSQEIRLHLREMTQPSPVYAQTVVDYIGPNKRALSALLARHIGTQADDEVVLQLGYGLVAMAQDYCMSRAFMKLLTPNYLSDPDALDRIRTRLLDWAEVLVEFERQRRAKPPAKPRRKSTAPGSKT
ncbi:AcrR family transcriptional regulator [Inhella inkyongensis]|uniref:AcrR family transcriptional regulator n=1 Tax=Inhella inkyongensis TaxID=392593 RepID=A0A840S372_9BURK|nr:CerR family C-terminal domain-containing protein [Inhella inkyongensis]MBB5203516.1 AcrR family transcriptional regulator [Inhella inkyongensis]